MRPFVFDFGMQGDSTERDMHRESGRGGAGEQRALAAEIKYNKAPRQYELYQESR